MDERLQFVARRLAGEGMTELAGSSESPVKQGTKSSTAIRNAAFRG